MLTGALLLGWLLSFAGSFPAFFGLQGWFDAQAYAEVAHLAEGTPFDFRWSVVFLCGESPVLLTLVYGVGLLSVLLFTLGVWTRLTGVLTWIVVVSFTVNPVLEYEGDALLAILTFYLMLGYLLFGQRGPGLGWQARLLGGTDTWLLGGHGPDRQPSLAANLAIRLLQVHLAVFVVTSGLHKLQFGDWWAGVAFWYLLYRPLETTLPEARGYAASGQRLLFVLSLAAYLTLAWQIAFPMFAWRRGARVLLLAGGLLGGLGAAFLYRLPWLGPTFFIACLCYLTPDEWERTRAVVRRCLWGRATKSPELVPSETTVAVRDEQ
jgi:hypothetical protein